MHPASLGPDFQHCTLKVGGFSMCKTGIRLKWFVCLEIGLSISTCVVVPMVNEVRPRVISWRLPVQILITYKDNSCKILLIKEEYHYLPSELIKNLIIFMSA